MIFFKNYGIVGKDSRFETGVHIWLMFSMFLLIKTCIGLSLTDLDFPLELSFCIFSIDSQWGNLK